MYRWINTNVKQQHKFSSAIVAVTNCMQRHELLVTDNCLLVLAAALFLLRSLYFFLSPLGLGFPRCAGIHAAFLLSKNAASPSCPSGLTRNDEISDVT